MSTTYTTNRKLRQPAANDRGWDAPINANTAILDAIAAIGGLAVTPTEIPSASLLVAVSAGRYATSANAYGTFAGQSATLTANATSYLYLTDAGSLTVASAWPTGVAYVALAVVVTGPTSVTSITDSKIAGVSVGGSGYAPIGSTYLVTNSDSTLTNERVLAATANQTTITDNGPGNTLSIGTVQPIATTSTPSFAQVNLGGDPTANTQAATKQYVDAMGSGAANANANANTRVLRAGDSMTGVLATKGIRINSYTIAYASGMATPVVAATDGLIRGDCTNGALQIGLPSPSSVPGLIVRIKKVDSTANSLTISSSYAIDGATSITLSTANSTRTLVADAASNTWNVC